MKISDLKKRNQLLLECISGSKAYGTDTTDSDTDIKGVFVSPREVFYSLEFEEQINEDGNNTVFYELRKFIELLSKNNPNLLELLAVPADCVLYKNPLIDLLRPEIFVSKLCKDSFAGYAMTQVKKARGLNKKIMNPLPKQRKNILDFCYVVEGQGSVPVLQFLSKHNLQLRHCGLAAIPHMRETYGLYYSETANYNGLLRQEDSQDITLSSVAEKEEPIAILSFNKDGFSKYCKEYKSYREWEEKRNGERYESTLAHGKNYDAKNMMHTFRLLDMAEEIGKTGEIIVRRPNRDFLLSIRNGNFSYDELVAEAEKRVDAIESVYAQSGLPERPDYEKINKLLVEIRTAFYSA